MKENLSALSEILIFFIIIIFLMLICGTIIIYFKKIFTNQHPYFSWENIVYEGTKGLLILLMIGCLIFTYI